MVRGLIIRQLFLVVDLLLIGAIVFMAAVLLMRMISAPASLVEAAVDTGAVTGESGDNLIDELRDRTAYNSIQDNGLFGDAGRFSGPEGPVEPEVTNVIDTGGEQETELNLKLWGTTSLSPTSAYATASIEDVSKRDRQLYAIGDMVVDQVTLVEIHQRWVILLNSRETPPQRERLSMDEEEAGETKVASNLPNIGSGGRATVLPTERVELDKKALIQEVYANYADLVTKVKPELYKDANGKVVGVTAQDIDNIPLAKELGLQSGDVLQTVNNEQIDSQEKVMEMVQKYQNAGSFRIGIMRNGKQKIITYNFR